MNLRRNSKAFTLVEALVALSILIVGIISGFILVAKALYGVTIIQDRLTASFLAQEGLELVRQIRDTNYLKTLGGTSTDWNSSLKTNGEYLIFADIDTGTVNLPLPSWQDKSLYYHAASGLYNYDDTGDAISTVFKRKIVITNIRPDEIRIQTIMNWKSKNISFNFTVEDHLFNWLKL
ncbi:MAG: type II secretion system protein [Candidatus Paceibacterota bacterium]